ncbi:hypothetical protein DYB37_001675 [Aphanomyces astaci]|uniref:Uncharacterized protein n=1 Tax=Aphanomyces astaci TaxID=112090 RepID=A0A418EI39_APHAT|nr:hypothetical protein DYB37_001675 [Aphanomyces astaci]
MSSRNPPSLPRIQGEANDNSEGPVVKRVKSSSSLPRVVDLLDTPQTPSNTLPRVTVATHVDDETTWKQLMQDDAAMASVKQALRDESSSSVPLSNAPRAKRKSFTSAAATTTPRSLPPDNTTHANTHPAPMKISLEESKRQALWQTLRRGSLAMAPIKRTFLPPAPVVAVPSETCVSPSKSQTTLSDDPPTTTILATLDQKLAAFESYLGETQALREDLDEARATISDHVSRIDDLTRLNQVHEQTIQSLQMQLQQSTQRQTRDSETNATTISARVLAWESFSVQQQRRRRRQMLLVMTWHAWRGVCRLEKALRLAAATVVARLLERRAATHQALRRALQQLQQIGAIQAGSHEALQAKRMVGEYRRHTRETAVQCAMLLVTNSVRNHLSRARQSAFCKWKRIDQTLKGQQDSFRQGALKLKAWLSMHWIAATRLALQRWAHHHHTFGWQAAVDTAAAHAVEYKQAKECVFDLTCTANQLREANAALASQLTSQQDKTTSLRGELQLTKHGFVATVVRRMEREGARVWFQAWHDHTLVQQSTRVLQTTVAGLQTQLDERDRFTKSLDAYNQVLQGDLERFQFVHQDTRLAVDVLTKKLLREESKHQAVVDELAAVSAQLQSLCTIEWDDQYYHDHDDDDNANDMMSQPQLCPVQLLQASKDLVVERLIQVFGIHADQVTHMANASATGRGVYLMSWDNCYELVQSTLCRRHHVPPDGSNQAQPPSMSLAEDMEMLAQLDSFFPPPPITLRAFVMALSAFLTHMQAHTTDDSVRRRLAGFWRALIDASDENDDEGGGSRPSTPSTTAAWTRKHNKLSDDIIQNQEKLLAVLEHETAVVERAVLDKASLKHTYPTDDDGEPHEPLPVIPSTPPTTASRKDSSPTSPCDPDGWLALPQVRDLVLAYQVPLLQLYVKYATPHSYAMATSTPQSPFDRQIDLAVHTLAPRDIAMSLQGALKLFEDLKLFPVVFPPDTVATYYTAMATPHSPSPSPPPTSSQPPMMLTCPGFIKLFGACILTTYAGRPTSMSIRERLHTFFYELHWTATTTRHPKPCYVGQEIESILWPLFEYYSGSGGHNGPVPSSATSVSSAVPTTSDARLAMTAAKFCRFMADIAGADGSRYDAELMFRKAVRVSRGTALASQMAFDEFYMGIYYMHQLRDTTKRYDSPGDALREWMQLI